MKTHFSSSFFLSLKRIFSSVPFYVLLFAMLRLYGITNPPLETGHNWRQVTGLMVARNFYETDANIFYPRVDDCGDHTGIVAMEFPSLNYLHFLLSKLFGFRDWYGRLINLAVSSLGVIFFAKLLQLIGFSRKAVLLSSLFLLSSVWFSFSRKMMPDTYCISLMFIGMYYAGRYLQQGRLFHLALYLLLASLAALSKIPAAIYFIYLVPLLFSRIIDRTRLRTLIIASVVPVVLTLLWYFGWNQKLVHNYHNWYNTGVPFLFGIKDAARHLPQILHRFCFDGFFGYIGFSLFVAGLVIMFIRRDCKMMRLFFYPFAVFVLYIIKSGSNFYDQNYYMIPFVPVMAVVAAYALTSVSLKCVVPLLSAAVVTEGIANQHQDFVLKDEACYLLKLENVMDKCSTRQDIIIVNGDGNGQMLYFAHRKGWSCSGNDVAEKIRVQSQSTHDSKVRCFVVLDKNKPSVPSFELPVVYEDGNFIVYACLSEKEKMDFSKCSRA